MCLATPRTRPCTPQALDECSPSQKPRYSSSPNPLTRDLLMPLPTSLFPGCQQNRTKLPGCHMPHGHHRTNSGAKNLPGTGCQPRKERPHESPDRLAPVVRGHARRRKHSCGWCPRSSQAGSLHCVVHCARVPSWPSFRCHLPSPHAQSLGLSDRENHSLRALQGQ